MQTRARGEPRVHSVPGEGQWGLAELGLSVRRGGTPPTLVTNPNPSGGVGKTKPRGGQQKGERKGGGAPTWARGDVAGSPLGDPIGTSDVAPGRGGAVGVPAAVVILGGCGRHGAVSTGTSAPRSLPPQRKKKKKT